MPQVRKLAPEEVQTIQNKGKGQRKLVEEEYDAIMGEYEVGEYGEAILEPEENRLTVRNRLRAAVGRRDLEIVFRRTSGDIIRFQIAEQGTRSKPVRRIREPEYQPEPEPEPVAPPKRKGGRPKKS